MKKSSCFGMLALLCVAVNGWEKEVVLQAAPPSVYTVLSVLVAVTCVLFVVIVVRYGLMR